MIPTLHRRGMEHSGGISPFEAFATSLSARVGAGNINGVAFAITLVTVIRDYEQQLDSSAVPLFHRADFPDVDGQIEPDVWIPDRPQPARVEDGG